jgi:hypothetical protein
MNNQESLIVKTPSNFVDNVKRWVTIDTQLKMIGDKTKVMRDERHNLGKMITEYMISNKMENKKIGIHDGDVRVYEKKEYSPLTFGFIQECLGEIIEDKAHVEYIIQHLKDSRNIKTAHDLRRTYTSSK